MTKELENLIQATLIDGKLEDYEKEALVKRAQKEGMDLVELEIYINAELQKRQMELREKNEALDAQYEKEKKEAIGPVCPRCGKQVPPLTLKCECGYEFTKGKVASSVKILTEKIEKIKASNVKDKNKKIEDAISMYVVPNTKEDIVEFLVLSVTNSKKKGCFLNTDIGLYIIFGIICVIIAILILIYGGKDRWWILFLAPFVGWLPLGLLYIALWKIIPCYDDWNSTAEVWRNKTEQVLMKGRSLLGDPDFQRQLDYYENMLNKK